MEVMLVSIHMKHRILTALCAVLVAMACGGRVTYSTQEPQAKEADAAPPKSSVEASQPTSAPSECPAAPPAIGQGCATESLECSFDNGNACVSSCVCERGSWVCSADTCQTGCPAQVPEAMFCNNSQLDLKCRYGCAADCECVLAHDGPLWKCTHHPC
jgi:hypothetical protein